MKTLILTSQELRSFFNEALMIVDMARGDGYDALDALCNTMAVELDVKDSYALAFATDTEYNKHVGRKQVDTPTDTR